MEREVPQDEQFRKPQQPQAGGQREDAGFPKPRRRGFLAKTRVTDLTAAEQRQLLHRMLSEAKQSKRNTYSGSPLSSPFSLPSVPQTGWTQLEVGSQWRLGNKPQRACPSTWPYGRQQAEGEERIWSQTGLGWALYFRRPTFRLTSMQHLYPSTWYEANTLHGSNPHILFSTKEDKNTHRSLYSFQC